MSPATVILALSLAFSPSTKDVRASAGRGASKTRVSVRGGTTTVVRGRGKAKLEVSLTTTGATCPAKARARVVAGEVARHSKAFRSQAMQVQVASSPRALKTFERGLGTLLRAGDSKDAGRQFGGLSVKLGALPTAGSTKTVGRGTTVTGLRGGGWSVVSSRRLPGGVQETVQATFGANRATTSFERSFAVAMPGGGSVDITVGPTGFGIHGQGGAMGPGMGASSGLASESPSGGEDSGGDEQQNENGNPQKQGAASRGGLADTVNPSGGDGKEKEEHDQSSGSVGLSSDGTFSASSLTLSNGAVANAINWNRLGAAAGQPSPIDDTESSPTGGGGNLCGAMAKPGFDPKVQYLEPDPQGHVSDPVDFL